MHSSPSDVNKSLNRERISICYIILNNLSSWFSTWEAKLQPTFLCVPQIYLILSTGSTQKGKTNHLFLYIKQPVTETNINGMPLTSCTEQHATMTFPPKSTRKIETNSICFIKYLLYLFNF